jgi:hypothetical protein
MANWRREYEKSYGGPTRIDPANIPKMGGYQGALAIIRGLGEPSYHGPGFWGPGMTSGYWSKYKPTKDSSADRYVKGREVLNPEGYEVLQEMLRRAEKSGDKKNIRGVLRLIERAMSQEAWRNWTENPSVRADSIGNLIDLETGNYLNPDFPLPKPGQPYDYYRGPGYGKPYPVTESDVRKLGKFLERLSPKTKRAK